MQRACPLRSFHPKCSSLIVDLSNFFIALAEVVLPGHNTVELMWIVRQIATADFPQDCLRLDLTKKWL
jgi:hypothetical protein